MAAPHLHRSRHLVGQAAVTLPAVAIFIYPGYHLLVAPCAVFPHYGRSIFGDPNGFGYPAGVENKRIPHARHTLESKMACRIVVWKMAFDALLASVTRIMKPVFVFAFHYMALSTKLRGSRFRVQSRRSKTHESAYPCKHQDQKAQNLPPFLFLHWKYRCHRLALILRLVERQP